MKHLVASSIAVPSVPCFHPNLSFLFSMSQGLYTRGFRDTKVDPHWVQDQPWSFNGPYRALKMDFEIVQPFSGLVCYFYIIYKL